MRHKIVIDIFKKEMLDIIRDKKTLFMMIVLPIILYPLLIIGFSQVMTMSMSSMEQKDIYISFTSKPSKELISIIENNEENSEQGNLKIIDVEDYEKALQDREIAAYVDIEQDSNTSNYKLYINSSVDDSYIATTRIESALTEYNQSIVESNIAKEGLDIKSTLQPITFEKVDTAKNEEVAGYFLGQILPFILIIGVLLGAIYPAIDVMAGEKERGTLETLLTLPISNLELVMGKYMAVSFSAMTTAILNVLSILLTIAFVATSGGLGEEMGVQGFEISKLILPLIITIVCVCLFAMVVSAISMCVCSLAKSFKDAQNYITPVMLLIMIPSYVSMVPTIELDKVTATIPVVNISLLIKSVLSFKSDLGLIALVLVSNIAFAILSIVVLSKMFNSEEILFGNSASFSFLEKRSNIKKGTMPSVSDGIILYSVNLVLIIYVGSLIQMKFGMTGIALTQAMIIGLPLLFAYYIKSDFKQIFNIKLPKIKYILGGILLWLGGYIIVMLTSQFLLYLFPQNMEVIEGLNNSLFIKDKLLLNLIVVAVLPAICEEIFFRGFLFTSLRKNENSSKIAILVSSILFGFMHIDFLRIIPTTILGIIFAYSVYKSGSIFVAMILHFLNNGLAVIGTHYSDSSLGKVYSLLELDFSNLDVVKLLVILVVSAILIGLGVLLLKNRINKEKSYAK